MTGNGTIGAMDWRAVSLHVSGDELFKEEWQRAAADIDEDGDIDEDDVQQVKDKIFE